MARTRHQSKEEWAPPGALGGSDVSVLGRDLRGPWTWVGGAGQRRLAACFPFTSCFCPWSPWGAPLHSAFCFLSVDPSASSFLVPGVCTAPWPCLPGPALTLFPTRLSGGVVLVRELREHQEGSHAVPADASAEGSPTRTTSSVPFTGGSSPCLGLGAPCPDAHAARLGTDPFPGQSGRSLPLPPSLL